MAPLRSTKPKRVRGPRRSTVQRQREEKAALLKEIETLRREQRRHLRRATVETDATLPPSPRPPQPPQCKPFGDATIAAAQLYQRLQKAETDQDLWIAGLHGFLRSYEASQPRPPLRHPLVLSTDPAQRRETLRACHANKICDAYALVQRHCGALDLSVPYTSIETFQDPMTSAQRITNMTIQPFPGVHSVRRVFDAMRYWMSNAELCITDEMGALTIREDDEDDGTSHWGDAYASLRRVRSTLACGVPIEGNFAVFRQLFEEEDRAVVTIQPVDDDPLYPFQPDACVKVGMTGAIVISKPSPESCVTLTRWASLQLTDQIPLEGEPIPERATAIGRDTMGWFDVLHNVLRERVNANAGVA